MTTSIRVPFLAATALFIPSLANAQVPADDVIIVTAQKRAQSLQDVPLSITAVQGDILEEAGAVDISRLDELVPGLSFGQSGADARPSIRGARTENVSNQQDPVIGFFVDGVYRSRTSQALAALVDVERVEVLRGPQGTLYGRNSFGGAINIISRAPEFLNSAEMDFTYGNYDRARVEGVFNAAASDTVALRIAGAFDRHDGYVENTFNGSEDLKDKNEYFFRGQLLWDPAGPLDFTLRASHWDQDSNGASEFGYFLAGTPIDTGADGFTFEEVVAAELSPINPRVGSGNTASDAGPYEIARDADFSLQTQQTTFDLEANVDLGWASLRSLSAYADFETDRVADSDLSIFPSALAGQIDQAETFSQELQLSSAGDSSLEWTVGAFFLDDTTRGTFFFDRLFATDADTNQPDTNTPAPTSDFNSQADVDTQSYAAYGQATYSLTDQFRLTGGLRYTRDEKRFSRLVNFAFTEPLVFDGTPFEDKATFEKVTWRAAAEYDLTADNLLYGSIATGFQSGGFNNSADAATGGASFDEQSVTAYEIGSKNRYGDLRVNLSLYYNDYEDLLAQEFVNVGTTTLAISTNAGQATALGGELELNWQATDALGIDLGLSATKSEFGSYLVREPISGETVDLDGTRIPMTPDITARLGARYEIDLRAGTITPRASAFYSSSYSTNDIDYSFGEQDGYITLESSLTYRPNSGRWSAEIWGRNLTDQAVLNRTVRFGQNAIAQNFGDPLTYGIRLGVKFK